METHTLTRQERGKLAESIASGLHRDPHDEITEAVRAHAKERYHGLIDDGRVSIRPAEVNSYRWVDLLPVSVPEDIGWRPDFFLKALIVRSFVEKSPSRADFWDQDLPPVNCRIRRIRKPFDIEERLVCAFTVYYPIEVKSGSKKTLTGQQAKTIPRVVDHVDHVHPFIVAVDIKGLPEKYGLEVEEFSTSDWSDSGNSSRYRS